MANPFVHIELNTTDVDKAKAFYGKLFNWEMQDVPMGAMGTYTLIKTGEGTGGGIIKHMNPSGPSMWLSYVLVDDIDAATEKAKSLGAEICKGSMEIEGTGWLSIILDPTGAEFGLWEPKGQ